MLKNKKELLDVIRQYFTVKLTDKVMVYKLYKLYKLYIADQCVGTLTLVIKGDKVEHGFTAKFEANFNYEGKDHTMYLVSGGEDELKKRAKQFYDYCLLNRASSSYLKEGN